MIAPRPLGCPKSAKLVCHLRAGQYKLLARGGVASAESRRSRPQAAVCRATTNDKLQQVRPDANKHLSSAGKSRQNFPLPACANLFVTIIDIIIIIIMKNKMTTPLTTPKLAWRRSSIWPASRGLFSHIRVAFSAVKARKLATFSL